jgi:DNA modification methylase
MLGTEDDGFDEKKALEEIGEPKAKKGEIYALGNHRIMCGDSTDPESVKKLAESAGASGKIGMLYFDPPYDIGLDYRR